MVLEISKEAQEELRKLYLAYPDVDSYQQNLIDDLLYHLSSNTSLRIAVSNGSIVTTATNRKAWNK